MNLIHQDVLSRLELQPWSEKVGPEYNDPPSATYGTTLCNGIREFQHTAPAYGGWLAGLNGLPIPPDWTRGTVIHSARMMFDYSIANGGSRIACEFDNRVADGNGNNFNFSNQLKIDGGWRWQCDPQTAKWTDVLPIAPLTPLTWHHVAFESFVDFVALKLAFKALVINGTRYLAPAQFADLTPMKDKPGHEWKRGANLQLQQVRQTAGTAWMYAENVSLLYLRAA